MKPYVVPPQNVHNNLPDRVAGPNGAWGQLPPRLRDEVLQSKQDALGGVEYYDWIQRYLKILAGDE